MRRCYFGQSLHSKQWPVPCVGHWTKEDRRRSCILPHTEDSKPTDPPSVWVNSSGQLCLTFLPQPSLMPYAQETFDVANVDATIVAEIGQSGGQSGYKGITGETQLLQVFSIIWELPLVCTNIKIIPRNIWNFSILTFMGFMLFLIIWLVLIN